MSGEPTDRSRRIEGMRANQDPVDETAERPVAPPRRAPPPRTGIREENPIALSVLNRLDQMAERNRIHHELMNGALRNQRRRRRPIRRPIGNLLPENDNPSNRNLEESSSEEEINDVETEEPSVEQDPSPRPPPPLPRRLQLQQEFNMLERRNQELDEELIRAVLEQEGKR